MGTTDRSDDNENMINNSGNSGENNQQSDELISKKELLEKYGISYGTLYRWRRLGLIPDEWFIRRSTYTGQETFFPRELVCARVELILENRDETSLEELARRVRKKDDGDDGSAALIIETAGGSRRIPITEIKTVKLKYGGREVDITNIFKELSI